MLRAAPGGHPPLNAGEALQSEALLDPLAAWLPASIKGTQSGVDSTLVCLWTEFVGGAGGLALQGPSFGGGARSVSISRRRSQSSDS